MYVTFDMSQIHPVIVNITSIPKSALASLHLKYFSTPFSGLAGLKLLELYYEALSELDDVFGWAAVVDGYTAGFVCAIRSKKSIQRMLLTRTPMRLLHWSLMQVLCRPTLLVNFVRRLTTPARDSGQWQRPAAWSEWYTYRALVVDQAYRQYRLADALTHHLVEEAKRRGVPGLISIVERSNSAARVTNVRNGFREVWRGDDRIVFARELMHAGHAEHNPSR
jgi:GNAT superfamily N-acetyltransferase